MKYANNFVKKPGNKFTIKVMDGLETIQRKIEKPGSFSCTSELTVFFYAS